MERKIKVEMRGFVGQFESKNLKKSGRKSFSQNVQS